METENKDPIISKIELDLTEQELNKIFLGSEKETENKNSINPEIIQKEVKQENSNEPQIKVEQIHKPLKLQRKKSKENMTDLMNKIKSKILKTKPKEKEKESDKPKTGRPKIWTEEKINQLKEEKRKLAEQRRNSKKEGIKVSQLATNEPITYSEGAKIVDSIIKTKKEIEEHITEKKVELKEILKIKSNRFLNNKQQCSDHLYKFARFDLSGVVVVCKHCSAMQTWSVPEWNHYLVKHRSKL